LKLILEIKRNKSILTNIVMEIENTNVKSAYEIIGTHFSYTRPKIWYWIQDFLDQLSSNSSILDLGCGNGRNMIDENHNFIGVDNCSSFLNICQQKCLNVLQSDITNLPFNDNTFDNIICIAVFHHLSNIERRMKCLNEMYRVLCPCGQILISVWSKNQSHNKKLNFDYGKNLVPWKSKNGNTQCLRYYYIFENIELEKLLIKSNFIIQKWEWIHGNEVITLSKKNK